MPAHPNMIESNAVIRKEGDLDGYFEAGVKPRALWGVGLEYERVGVLRGTTAPVPYDGPASVEALIQAADKAMYRVKEHGKNGIFIAGTEPGIGD